MEDKVFNLAKKHGKLGIWKPQTCFRWKLFSDLSLVYALGWDTGKSMR